MYLSRNHFLISTQPFGGSIKALKAYSSITWKSLQKIGQYLRVHFTMNPPAKADFSGTFYKGWVLACLLSHHAFHPNSPHAISEWPRYFPNFLGSFWSSPSQALFLHECPVSSDRHLSLNPATTSGWHSARGVRPYFLILCPSQSLNRGKLTCE